ncbi:GIY-YIG nuclease family protein [Ancylobacter sp.]|uniref:GIY-YIG nuclease family protein n=1 Tax=Ancylobacter sp. TaxID=1872567 RepID=UPI003BAC9B6F
MAAFVYMLHCADGSNYIGSTSGPLEKRLAEHQDGSYRGYTFRRRPVALVWSEAFERITDAISAERQIKGWSRIKKDALVRGDWDTIRGAARGPSVREGWSSSLSAPPTRCPLAPYRVKARARPSL